MMEHLCSGPAQPGDLLGSGFELKGKFHLGNQRQKNRLCVSCPGGEGVHASTVTSSYSEQSM